MVGCRAGVCLKVVQKNMLPKKKRYKRQILELSCHIVFQFFGYFISYLAFQDCHSLSAKIVSKCQPELRPKSAPKKRGKNQV